MTLLTMLKGLPLAYNKDMQEDKEAIFDAVDTLKLCLTAFIPMVETMKAIPENMRKAAAKGFINATDCADYLVGKGLAFRMLTRLPALWSLIALKRIKRWKICRLPSIGSYATFLMKMCMTPFLWNAVSTAGTYWAHRLRKMCRSKGSGYLLCSMK